MPAPISDTAAKACFQEREGRQHAAAEDARQAILGAFQFAAFSAASRGDGIVTAADSFRGREMDCTWKLSPADTKLLTDKLAEAYRLILNAQLVPNPIAASRVDVTLWETIDRARRGCEPCGREGPVRRTPRKRGKPKDDNA